MNRKLTAARVLVIRQHEAGVKHEALAAEHHVHRSTITRILNGVTWAWCSTPLPRFSTPKESA